MKSKKRIQVLYCLLAEKYPRPFEPTGPKERTRDLKGVKGVKDYEINDYYEDVDANAAILFYLRWKRMGMPYGPWGINPNILCEVIDVIAPLDDLYHPPIM